MRHGATKDRIEVKIWGARGSLPIAAPCYNKFGGNTMCLELRCGESILLFDAGSGLPVAGRALLDEGKREFHLFFSHSHYDHIIGLPFFLPLYFPDVSVTFWTGHLGQVMKTNELLAEFMHPPFFPVGPEVFKSAVVTHEFQPGDTLNPSDKITIKTARLNHPGGAVGYRVEFAGQSVAMVFDTVHEPGVLDDGVMDLIRGVDLFFYDSSFTDEEFERFRHFGHSTWQQAIRLAQASGAKRVGFIHHSPFRTDAELSLIEAEARQLFPGAFCARDMQKIEI